jgi:hypothetical protein
VTIVVETATAECHHCAYAKTTAATVAQTLHVTLPSTLLAGGGTSGTRWHVWRTLSGENSWFIQQPDINATTTTATLATPHTSSSDPLPLLSLSFSLTIAPQSVYTISTTSGQSKGSFPSPPAASAPFPANWADNFDGKVV